MTYTVMIAHPSAELYGSDRVMLETLAGLVERGVRVIVTLPQNGPLTNRITSYGGTVAICPTLVLRKAYLRGLGPFRLIGAAMRAVVPSIRLLRSVRPDVLYVSTLTIPSWLLIAKVLGIGSVCHVHEAESQASLLTKRALALPLLLASKLIVNSKFSLGVLTAAFSSLANKAEVIYNGVAGPPTVATPRITLDGPARILYIGRISVRKGIDVAISAISKLKDSGIDAELEILGAVFPGYETVLTDLRQQVSATGNSDRVRFLGFHSEIWPFLESADIVVVPSRFDEPFGNTAVEAILAARPVVASATSGLLEAVDGFESARSVTPSDPEALASAIEDVVAQWSMVRTQAVSDSELAADRYSLDRYRAAVAAVLLPE